MTHVQDLLCCSRLFGRCSGDDPAQKDGPIAPGESDENANLGKVGLFPAHCQMPFVCAPRWAGAVLCLSSMHDALGRGRNLRDNCHAFSLGKTTLK